MTGPDLPLLAAFCNARLDEDEAAARELQENLDSGYYDDLAGLVRRVADPARTLREVAAKRALIVFIFANASSIDGEWGDDHTADEIAAGKCSDHGAKAATGVLVLLAAIWADHPDYRQEWA